MSEEKDLQLHRATLAEQAERYDDMAKVSSASLEIKWTFRVCVRVCVWPFFPQLGVSVV